MWTKTPQNVILFFLSNYIIFKEVYLILIFLSSANAESIEYRKPSNQTSPHAYYILDMFSESVSIQEKIWKMKILKYFHYFANEFLIFDTKCYLFQSMACSPAMTFHVGKSDIPGRYLLRGDSEGQIVMWTLPEVTERQMTLVRQESFDRLPGKIFLFSNLNSCNNNDFIILNKYKS